MDRIKKKNQRITDVNFKFMLGMVNDLDRFQEMIDKNRVALYRSRVNKIV
jgi:hypothetical protein